MPNDMRDNRGASGNVGALRGERTSVGTEDQSVRLGDTGNRGAHISRGSYIHGYADLGISTTKENAGEIRKQESEFQSNVSTQQGKVTEAKGQLQNQYETGKKTIDSQKSGITIQNTNDLISKGWESARKSFIPVTLVNGSKVEGTYYLPMEATKDLANNKNLWTNYANGGLYVDVKSKGGRHTVGKELHDSLRQAEKDVYNGWYVANAPAAQKITEQQKAAQAEFDRKKSEAYNSLNASYTLESGKVQEAQLAIDSAVYKRAAEWEDLRGDYAKKKATIAEIFSNFNVEEGGK